MQNIHPPKYLFKYLALEEIDPSVLVKLLQESRIIYRPSVNDESHPYRKCNGWITFQQLVKHHRIYIPHFTYLNDPYECLLNIDCAGGADDETLYKCYQKMKEKVCSLEVFKRDILKLQERKNLLSSRRIHIQSPSFGIYSLCEDPCNILMWSYYASNHAGVCIAFEIDWDHVSNHMEDNEIAYPMLKDVGFRFKLNSLDGSFINMGLQKVYYDDQPGQCGIDEYLKAYYDPDIRDRLTWVMTSTKFSDWDHEKEWRLVSFNQWSHEAKNLFRLKNLEFMKPCAIILGQSMKVEFKEIIKKLCKQYKILELNRPDYCTFSTSLDKKEIIEQLKYKTAIPA